MTHVEVPQQFTRFLNIWKFSAFGWPYGTGRAILRRRDLLRSIFRFTSRRFASRLTFGFVVVDPALQPCTSAPRAMMVRLSPVCAFPGQHPRFTAYY
jgi:hypothetical protein